MLFADHVDSWLCFPYMLASVFCKVAVPIFFMISGALLLPKQESLGKLFSKRILRMVIVLIAVSAPYYYWLCRLQGLRFSGFLTYIYENSASTALWYLYSYIALLLMMPFLRCMVKTMKRGDFLYLIAGYLVMVGVVPCVEYCLWGGDKKIHESFTPVLFLTQNMFFALAGYYAEHIVDIGKCGKRMITQMGLLNAISFAVTAILTYHQLLSGEKDPAQLERYFNCFVAIPAISLFILIRYIGDKIRNLKMKKIIGTLGGAVFGVYLIEKFVRALTTGVYRIVVPVLGSFGASMVWCFLVLCISLLIVLLLKHTPIIKKVVNKFI